MDKPKYIPGQSRGIDELTRILDGDTTETADGTRQRLDGFDSYETDKPGKISGNPLADPGTEALRSILDDGGTVDGSGRFDKYGREISTLRDAEGNDQANELIQAGLAQPINVGSSHKDKQRQGQAEMTSIARQALGLPLTDSETLAPHAERAAEIRAKGEWRPFTGNPDMMPELKSWDRRGTFEKSWDRGVAGAKASAGGFLNWLGDATGNEEWVAKGKQMTLSGAFDGGAAPREIETYKDIDNLDDAVTYLIETGGEMAPQILMDGATLLAGAGAGGMAAILTRRAAMAGAAKVGGLAATAGSGFVQSTGNMENVLESRGSEVNTGAAAASGVAGAVLNTAPIAAVLPRFGKAAGLSDEVMEQTLSALDRVKDIRTTAAIGGGTEGAATLAQSIVDQMIEAEAMGDKSWELDTTQAIDDTIRGVLGGGAASAAGSGMAHGYSAMVEYNEARRSVDAEGNAIDKEGYRVDGEGKRITDELDAPEDTRYQREKASVRREDIPDLTSDEYGYVRRMTHSASGKPVDLKTLGQRIENGKVTPDQVIRYLADTAEGESNALYGRFYNSTEQDPNKPNNKAQERLADLMRDKKLKQQDYVQLRDMLDADWSELRERSTELGEDVEKAIYEPSYEMNWKRMWHEYADRSAKPKTTNQPPQPHSEAVGELDSQANEIMSDFDALNGTSDVAPDTTPDVTPEQPKSAIKPLGLTKKKGADKDTGIRKSVGEQLAGEHQARMDKANKAADSVAKVINRTVEDPNTSNELKSSLTTTLYAIEHTRNAKTHKEVLEIAKEALIPIDKVAAPRTAQNPDSAATARSIAQANLIEQLAKTAEAQLNMSREKQKPAQPKSPADRRNAALKRMRDEGLIDDDLKAAMQLLGNTKVSSRTKSQTLSYVDQRVDEFLADSSQSKRDLADEPSLVAFGETDPETGEARTVGDVQSTVSRSEYGLDFVALDDGGQSERERKANESGFTRQVADLFEQLIKIKGIDPQAAKSTMRSVLSDYVGPNWKALLNQTPRKKGEEGAEAWANAAHPYKVKSDADAVNRDKDGQRPVRALKKQSIDKLAGLMANGKHSEAIEHLTELGLFAPGHVIGEMPKVSRAVRLKQNARTAEGRHRKSALIETSDGKSKFVMETLVRHHLAETNRSRGGKKGDESLSDIEETTERNGSSPLDTADDHSMSQQLMVAITDAMNELLENGYDIDFGKIPDDTVAYSDRSSPNKMLHKVTIGDVRNLYAQSTKYKHKKAMEQQPDYDDTNRLRGYGSFVGDLLGDLDGDDADVVANREDRDTWSSIDEAEKASGFHGQGEGTSVEGSAGKRELRKGDKVTISRRTTKDGEIQGTGKEVRLASLARDSGFRDLTKTTDRGKDHTDINTDRAVDAIKAEIARLERAKATKPATLQSRYDDWIQQMEAELRAAEAESPERYKASKPRRYPQKGSGLSEPTPVGPQKPVTLKKQSEAKSLETDGRGRLPGPAKVADAPQVRVEKDAKSANPTKDLREAKKLVRKVARKRGAARKVLFKVVRSIDTRLRNIHPEIADAAQLFTVDAQGYANDFVSKMESIGNNRRIQKGWQDAIEGRKTPEAGAYMKWLNDVDEEIMTVDKSHKKHTAPRLALDMESVDKHRKGFAELLKKAGVKDTEAYIEKLFNGNGVVEFATEVESVGEAKATSGSLAKIGKELREGGFLDTDAPRALLHYAHAAGRHMSWRENMEADGKLKRLMAEVHPKDKDEALKLFEGITGRNAVGTPHWLRVANSVTLAFNTATILWFSAVASVPELAGVVARNRGTVNDLHKEFGKMLTGVKRDELRKFAKDYGVIGGEVTQHALQQLMSMDEMTVGRTAQRVQNRVFQMNGQRWLTEINRALAASAARNFLATHAADGSERSKRLLAELGTDAETINKHLENGDRKTKEGRAYTKALHRFVNQAVTNPRADQLPLIATDPRYAMVTSLKKFFYGFYGNVNKGLMADLRESGKAGSVSPAVRAMVLTAVTVVPMAILAELLREKIKYPLGRPGGQAEKTTSEYLTQVLGATGMFGPLHMAQLPAEMTQYGKNAFITFAGPTASYLVDAVNGDLNVSRHVPIASQQPYLGRLVNKSVDKLFE